MEAGYFISSICGDDKTTGWETSSRISLEYLRSLKITKVQFQFQRDILNDRLKQTSQPLRKTDLSYVIMEAGPVAISDIFGATKRDLPEERMKMQPKTSWL